MGKMGELFAALPMASNPKFRFSEFWNSYPKRRGPNPKFPAEKKYYSAVKDGADPEWIISSAKAYADESRDDGTFGTEFICQARTWLNQKRWEGYEPDPGSKERDAKIDADMKKRGYEWKDGKWQKDAAPQH